jgi:hypothetical protein
MASGWVCFDLLGLVPILGMIVPNMGIFKYRKNKQPVESRFPHRGGSGNLNSPLKALIVLKTGKIDLCMANC